MITIHLDKIEAQRRKKHITIYELGKLVDEQPPTLCYFLKRGKQLKKDLSLIDRLCAVLGLDWKQVIKYE